MKIEMIEGMPLEGKIMGFSEDSITVSSGRRDLRITLVARNEFLGKSMSIPFIRGGDRGNILTSLIDDFKIRKNFHIKGIISYPLHKPSFFNSKKDKELRMLCGDLRCLLGIKDWNSISLLSKEKLKEYISNDNIWPIEINTKVFIDDEPRYLIILPKERGELALFDWRFYCSHISASIYLLK